MDHWLGVDYGTSNTVAVLRWPDGRTRPLLFDGSPLLPSAICGNGAGPLLVGRDAERHARLDPTRFEPNPKRRIDDGELLLGDTTVAVTAAISATLRRVAEEATRTAGAAPGRAVLTYPAAWGARRRSVLVAAASGAGLPAPTLVPEPVAAAAYFATVLGHRVPVGGCVVVYDLGAGTFDASVVRREPDGYAVIDVDGIPDFGGLDLDSLVVDRVRQAIEPTAPQLWRQLSAPGDTASRRAFRTLWEDARGAKETLSRHASVALHVPLADRDVLLSREDFESAAGTALRRAAELTERLMRRAGLTDSDLAGVFLVGGSSRVPMVGTSLHRATGIAPTVIEQPELVVAEGSLHTQRPQAPAPAPGIAFSPPFAAAQPAPAAYPPPGAA
ncbi:MAG: Hsp70 family protein, partial [Micromonosporaceae bacterium]